MKWVFDGSFLRSFCHDYYLNFVNWCQLLQVLMIFHVNLDCWLKDRLLLEE